MPFAELAQTGEPYEVARLFLAALQLTNWGNVELEAAGSVDGGDMTLTVNLLDKTRKRIVEEA